MFQPNWTWNLWTSFIVQLTDISDFQASLLHVCWGAQVIEFLYIEPHPLWKFTNVHDWATADNKCRTNSTAGLGKSKVWFTGQDRSREVTQHSCANCSSWQHSAISMAKGKRYLKLTAPEDVHVCIDQSLMDEDTLKYLEHIWHHMFRRELIDSGYQFSSLLTAVEVNPNHLQRQLFPHLHLLPGTHH